MYICLLQIRANACKVIPWIRSWNFAQGQRIRNWVNVEELLRWIRKLFLIYSKQLRNNPYMTLSLFTAAVCHYYRDKISNHTHTHEPAITLLSIVELQHSDPSHRLLEISFWSCQLCPPAGQSQPRSSLPRGGTCSQTRARWWGWDVVVGEEHQSTKYGKLN